MSTPTTLLESLRARISVATRRDRSNTSGADTRTEGVSPGSGALVRDRRAAVGLTLAAALVCAYALLAGGTATPAEAEGDACSNAEIREQQSAHYLPDCRAYEQVSPVWKNGNGIQDQGTTEKTGPVIATPDGSAAVYTTFGTFADSPSTMSRNIYQASRTETDWTSRSLNAPAFGGSTPFVYVATAGTTTDNAKQLIATGAALTPGTNPGSTNNYNLYIQDRVAGTYEFVAASSRGNSSNVTFAAGSPNGDRWFVGVRNSNIPTTPQGAGPLASTYHVYEYADGELNLVDVLPDGTAPTDGGTQAGPDASMNPNIGYRTSIATRPVNEDGTQIYWSRDQLVNDPLAEREQYLYRDGASTLVTERESDGSTQKGRFWFASSDGRYAVISSDAQLTSDASPAGIDLYRYDRDTGNGDLVDLTPTASDAGFEAVLDVSPAGDYVYFQATGALTPDATAGAHNVYVWHDNGAGGELKLIATSSTSVYRGYEPGLQTNDVVSLVGYRSSDDGRYFGFVGDGELTGPNPHPAPDADQVYLYDYDEDSLVCASCGSGFGSAGPAIFERYTNSGTGVLNTYQQGLTRNVLDDGSVYFSTPEALVPEDRNSKVDAYRYKDGEISLISSGRGIRDAFFADASLDGSNAFVLSADELAGQDKDDLYDLYDARVDGGLATQNPVSEPTCQGDGCQGEQGTPPEEQQPGSGGFKGDGNQSNRCRRQEGKAERKAQRAQRIERKAHKASRAVKKAKRTARQASGKRAHRLTKKAKRLSRKARQLDRRARSSERAARRATRALRNCRSSQ